VPNLNEAVAEHRDLLLAIRNGDPEVAAEVMSRHVRGFEAEIRRTI
jgi:DNA-binding GntR family transcriptional regulator